MARRRKNNSSRLLGTAVFLMAGSAAFYYWFWPLGDSGVPSGPASGADVPLTSDRPDDSSLDGGPYADVPERGQDPAAAAARNTQDPQRGQALLASARRAMEQQQLVTARAQLSEALACDLPLEKAVQTRADLTRLARQTIFSNAITKDDPFVEAYVIQPGDSLNKIAKRYSITDDFLASINNIPDKNRIRAGQRIKVVHGPFHAVVTKADYSLDVYLGGTFVKHFPVGLGEHDSTPTGRWQVCNKLKNPTYYPPRGGDIMLADDPQNPLGERWLGLEGTEGEALGQERYGIHGTIEPDSIGRNASMGCIRMHNPDVEELYDLLVEKKSEITVR